MCAMLDPANIQHAVIVKQPEGDTVVATKGNPPSFELET